MRAISNTQAARGIYIDFEGGGAVRTSFLGVLRLNTDTKEEIFHQYLLDEELWPIVSQCDDDHPAVLECADLTNVLKELRELAESEERCVFAYSQHELRMIKNHLQDGELLRWWCDEKNFLDAKKVAKRWKTLKRSEVTFEPKEGQISQHHSLENYLKLINYEVPSEYGPGVVASAIDLVRNELIETNGGPLSKDAKFAWKQAVMHNFHDCDGMRKLMIICADEAPPSVT